MKASDLLVMLMYGIDIASRPTFNNLTQGSESWMRYNRLHRSHISKLKGGGMLERSEGDDGPAWVLKLTEKGRLKALGGRDLELAWKRDWDGEWRFLMFDIPKGCGAARRRLYYWLRKNHFGYLQRSVWLRPDSFEDCTDAFEIDGVSAGDVVVVEGRPCVGVALSDAALVARAWDWQEINGRYQEYIDFCRQRIESRIRPGDAKSWVAEERSLWTRAVRADPLLPEALLPPEYLGKKAWEARRKVMKKAAPMVAALDAE